MHYALIEEMVVSKLVGAMSLCIGGRRRKSKSYCLRVSGEIDFQNIYV